MPSPATGRSLPAYFFLSMATTALGVLLFVAALLWFERSARFERESADLTLKITREKEERLRQEVGKAVAYAEHAALRAEERLRHRLEEQVGMAESLVRNLYAHNKDRMSRPELEELLREALRPLRFAEGRGYFFVTRANGQSVLFADRPEFEGKSLLGMRDVTGKAVVRELIAATASGGGAFVEYHWTKPGSQAASHPKLAYVTRFAPLDWIIGTGEYLDDAALEVQNEVIGWLARLRFGPNGYIFGSTLAGDPLFTNGRITRGGPSILDLTDPNGVKIIQEQIEAGKEPEGGFVRYVWPSLSGGPPQPKISFVQRVPRWGWIIGSGISLDAIDTAVADLRERMRQDLRTEMLRDVLIVVGIFAALALSTIFFSRRTKRELDAFSSALDEAVRHDAAIDTTGLLFRETRRLAASVNELTRSRMAAQASLRRSETLLRLSEEQFRTLVANIPGMAYRSEIEAPWRLVYVSEPVRDITGHPPEEFLGDGPLRFGNLILPEDLAGVEQAVAQSLADGTAYDMEYRIRRVDGEVRWVQERGRPALDENGSPLWLDGVILDVSGRKKAEQALRASEEQFRTLAEQSPVSIMALDAEGRVSFVNDWHLKVFCLGRVERDFFLGKRLSELPGLSSVPGLSERLLDVLRGRTIFLEEIFMPRFTGGHSGWVTIRGVPIRHGDAVTGGILIREDITERKRMIEALRDSERRLTQVIQFLPDPMLAVDRDGRIRAWNRAMEALTGVPADTILGRGDREYSKALYGDRRHMLLDYILDSSLQTSERYEIIAADDDSLTAVAAHEKPGAETAWYLLRASAIRDGEGRLAGAIESVRDITTSRTAEQELKASLQEKEVLLREIHHRVKNNLQVISSMLRLQAGELGGEDIQPILESLARIRSMSLVHEKLYLSSNLGAIDMADYVTSQLSALIGIYGAHARGVHGSVQGGGLLLPVDHAIPCGLVINELVTNSLKHAFAGRETGSISIGLSLQDGQAVVTAQDDGVGLAEGFDPLTAQSVGLQIVQGLTMQLKGTLRVLPSLQGCAFELRFPMPGA